MSFSSDIQRFNKKVVRRFITIKRRAGLALFTNIIMDTPVLTGTLRNNWHFNMGTPSDLTLDTFDKSGANTVARLTTGLEQVDAYTTFYFTNNLPYLPPIEYDSYSAQAPNGVVRINAARWDRIVQAAAKGVK